jgi:hypothetical protein
MTNEHGSPLILALDDASADLAYVGDSSKILTSAEKMKRGHVFF